MEKPKVTLIYNGVKREILRRTMMKAGFFADHYENRKDFLGKDHIHQNVSQISRNC